MSTKSCDLLGVSAGVMSGWERASSAIQWEPNCAFILAVTPASLAEKCSLSSLEKARCASYARQLWVAGFWKTSLSRGIPVSTVSIYTEDVKMKTRGALGVQGQCCISALMQEAC